MLGRLGNAFAVALMLALGAAWWVQHGQHELTVPWTAGTHVQQPAARPAR